MGKKIKTCIIGDTAVGKTSILTRIIENNFKEQVNSTVGVDYKYQERKVNGEDVGVELWDTSGQDKYRSVAKNFFRNSDGVIIVFSMSEDTSLTGLEYWMNQIKDNLDSDVPKILLANKCDLTKEFSEEAKKMVEKIRADENIKMFKVSAKTGVNIKEAYEYLLSDSLDYVKKKVFQESVIIKPRAETKKGCC